VRRLESSDVKLCNYIPYEFFAKNEPAEDFPTDSTYVIKAHPAHFTARLLLILDAYN